jgi:hypothetical protein
MLHNALCSEERQVDLEQKSHERSFIRELVPDWRPTRAQVLWAVRIVIVLVVLLSILTLIGLPFGITLWEWVKLLIVPAVIAAGGLWFNRQQRDREMEIAREQRDRDQEFADQRAQDAALQAYLDQMGQLLLDKDRPLRLAEVVGDEVETMEAQILARSRTLTVLPRLDGGRKGSVVRFLYESGLISKDRPIVILTRADLREADLFGFHLEEANLYGTDLRVASLRMTFLSGANLNNTLLVDANLYGAHLSGASLSNAYLMRAFLSSTQLDNADLSGANLTGAEVTDEQLAKVKSLKGATMPNGQKYEDWLKSREEEGG